MKRRSDSFYETDVEREAAARMALVRKQAQSDPVCAELLALTATMHMAGGGQAYISTMLDYEDEDDDFRPY